jgi:hypothetical protein
MGAPSAGERMPIRVVGNAQQLQKGSHGIKSFGASAVTKHFTPLKSYMYFLCSLSAVVAIRGDWYCVTLSAIVVQYSLDGVAVVVMLM